MGYVQGLRGGSVCEHGEGSHLDFQARWQVATSSSVFFFMCSFIGWDSGSCPQAVCGANHRMQCMPVPSRLGGFMCEYLMDCMNMRVADCVCADSRVHCQFAEAFEPVNMKTPKF